MTLNLVLVILAIVSFALASARVSGPLDFFPLAWLFLTCAWAFGGGHI